MTACRSSLNDLVKSIKFVLNNGAEGRVIVNTVDSLNNRELYALKEDIASYIFSVLNIDFGYDKFQRDDGELPRIDADITSFDFVGYIEKEERKNQKELSKDIESLTSENWTTAKTIPKEAFQGYPNLKKVELENVVEVNDKAFSQCPNLKEVDLFDTIEIGASAFRDCHNLVDIFVPRLNILGDYSLASTGIREFRELNNKVKYLGYGAFQNCKDLRKVEINDVKCITEYTFEGCTELESVYASSATKIKTCAFKGSGIVYLNLDSIETIEVDAFKDILYELSVIIRNESKLCRIQQARKGIDNVNFYVPDKLYEKYLSIPEYKKLNIFPLWQFDDGYCD